jgi:putative phosphoribosyl transferase
MYRDRPEAGQELAAALKQFRLDRPLVLGLPRGGVVVAAEVARELAGDLDVLLVKKLCAPDNPELAIGALSEDGKPFLNRELVTLTGSDRRYVDREIAERRQEIDEQRQRYRAVKPRISPAGRTVILVDDGLATGATMIAAVQATRLAKPKKLIVAVPVGSPEAVETLARKHEVVCLETPSWFSGVGQFYEDFSQVSDDEVLRVLAGGASMPPQ